MPTGRLARNLGANFVGQTVVAGLALLLIPAYVRLLGPEAYAIVGLYGVLQAWLAVLDLGTGPTLNREMALMTAGQIPAHDGRDLLRTLEFVLASAAVVTACFTALVSPWLARNWLQGDTLGMPEVATSLSLMGILIGLRLMETLYRSALLGLENQVTYNVVVVAAALLRAVGSLALLGLAGGTLTEFFLLQVFISLLTVVALAALTYRVMPPSERRGRFSRKMIRAVRAFAGGVLVITTVSLLLSQTDKLVLSRLAPLSDVGFYTACWTLAAGLFFVVGPVTQAWYPRLTDLWSRSAGDDLARLFHAGAQAIAVAAGTITMIMVVFADQVTSLWLGRSADPQVWPFVLVLLALGTLANCLVQLPYYSQLAAGWTSLAATANILAAPLYVPAVIWGVYALGPIGAALGWLTLNVGMLIVVAPLTFRRVLQGQRRAWVVRDLLLPLLGIAVVGCGARWALAGLDGGWAVLLGLVCAFAGLAAGVLGSTNLRAALRHPATLLSR